MGVAFPRFYAPQAPRSKIQALFGSSLCTAQESAISVPNRCCSVCAACIVSLGDTTLSSAAQFLGLTRPSLNHWRTEPGLGRPMFCHQLCHWSAEWALLVSTVYWQSFVEHFWIFTENTLTTKLKLTSEGSWVKSWKCVPAARTCRSSVHSYQSSVSQVPQEAHCGVRFMDITNSCHQSMRQQWVHSGLQKEHGWEPGKEAVPLRLGSLPPGFLQEQSENVVPLAELKPRPHFVSL